MLVTFLCCWLPWIGECFVLQDDSCLIPTCNCTRSDVIDCSNQDLNSIPTFQYSRRHYSILTLQFSSNNLSDIPDHAFASTHLHHVKHVWLNLSDNSITSIGNDVFDGIAEKITVIDLNDNNLQTIPAALRNLGHLRSLYIANNPVINLHSAGVSNLARHLTDFSFGHPSLVQWPTELKQFHHLNTLTISGARVSVIPLETFRYSQITRLTLNGTDLFELSQAICDLRRLVNLEFSFSRNIGTGVGLFKPCPHALNSVAQLILDNNDFYQVPTDIFGTFPNLKVLRIRGSKLLSDLDDLAVPSFNHLQILDLKGDNFATIPEVVSRFLDITTLNFSENPVICNCFMSWMKKWSRRDNVTIVGICQGGETIRHYIDNSLMNFC